MLYNQVRCVYSKAMQKTNREKVEELKQKGLTVIQISKLLNLSRTRVYQLLDKHYNASRRKLLTGQL